MVLNQSFVKDINLTGNTIIDIWIQGFDNYVYIILQKHDLFNDITKKDKNVVQKSMLVKNGQRFVIPAEYDILITFAPISNDDGSILTNKGGFIKI